MREDDDGTSDCDISVGHNVDSEHPSDDELFPLQSFHASPSVR